MSFRKLLLLFVFAASTLAMSAQFKVSGVVVDESGEAVIGASVVQKGKPSNGVATDIDGKFTLTVPNNKSQIVVTYVGYEKQELTVKSGVMKIALKVAGQVLDGVVVTGMAKVDSRMFTGATTKIDAEKTKLSGVADISRGLEGKVSGVQVSNVSGTFGTAPKIRVRGATSIYGSSKPLWIVDGVELADNVELSADDLSSGDAVTLISSAIAGLNADDIESFQILKDGSATSIYGAKAMAGVIVVTTKTGRTGHTSINYTGEFTYRMKPSYRDYNICNSQEQMGIYKEMEQKGWLEFASLRSGSRTGVYGRMYNMLDNYIIDPITGEGHFELANTTQAKNAYLREAEFRNTDWFDLLFNSNVMQNHAVSISGGTDKGSFYTSASVMTDPGWYKSSSVERYTFNANALYNLSSRVRVKLLTSDSFRKQKAPGTISQQTDVVNGEVSRSFDINPFSYAMNTSRTLDPNVYYRRNYTDFNIFNELQNNWIDLTVTDLKFQGEVNIKPIMNQNHTVEVNMIGYYRYSNSENNHFVTENSNQARAYRAGIDPEDAIIRASNTYLYTDPDVKNALPETVLPKGGMLFHNKYDVSQYVFRGTANWNGSFNRDHTINMMAGLEASRVDRHSQSFDGWGIVYANGNLPFINSDLFKQMQEENSAYYSEQRSYRRNLAYFATANYSYKMRYVLTGTLRYEGSNQMGKTTQSRWLPTWNVSAAWNAHQEPFFTNARFFKSGAFTYAKLRTSYSLTAETGPTSYANAEALYYPNRIWNQETDGQQIGLELSGLANSELTYEKKHEFDVGVDLGFVNNRINFVFDWYKRNNFDLIGRVYTEGVGGQTMKYANVAEMASHGVEFTLTTHNIKSANPDGFNWTTDITFAYAKNEITKLVSRSRAIDLIQGTGFALEGYPVRALFSYQFVGLDSHGIPQVINETTGELSANDEINFQQFDAELLKKNLKYEGAVDPTITGGFNNSFSWKGLHLNVFCTYSFGNKLRLSPDFSYAYSDLTAMPKEFKNRWVMPGDEAYTTIPVIASRRQYYADTYLGRAYSAYNYSSARVADGGFIRLKEISLTYDIPKSLLKAIRLNNASVKLSATNIGLLYADDKLNGQDPEFYNAGGVASPNPRQFTLTVRFGL